MLTKEQEEQIRNAIYDEWKQINKGQSDMIIAAIKKYDEIVNPKPVEVVEREKVITYLEGIKRLNYLAFDERELLCKLVERIKAGNRKLI